MKKNGFASFSPLTLTPFTVLEKKTSVGAEHKGQKRKAKQKGVFSHEDLVADFLA